MRIKIFCKNLKNFRAQVDPVVLFDATIQKKVTDRAADIEVLFNFYLLLNKFWFLENTQT